jgi:hypothetical protein
VTKTHQPLNRHVNKYNSDPQQSPKPKDRFTTKENFYHSIAATPAVAESLQTTDADVEVSTQQSSAGATLPKRQKTTTSAETTHESEEDMGKLFANELNEPSTTTDEDPTK